MPISAQDLAAYGRDIDAPGAGIVDLLRVERLSALEEGVLVAKRTVMGAAAGDDDRVRHKIAFALDQIAPYARDAL